MSFIKYIMHLFFYKAVEWVYFDDVLLVRFLQDLDFSNTTTIDAIIFAINSLTDDSLVGNVFVSCLVFLWSMFEIIWLLKRKKYTQIDFTTSTFA